MRGSRAAEFAALVKATKMGAGNQWATFFVRSVERRYPDGAAS
jgi:hypothetical protein